MLASLSVAIAASFDNSWIVAPVQEIIPEGGPSAERLSRLKARLLGPMEKLVREATRRGRPPRPAEAADESLVLRKLLALVPRQVWTYLRREQRAALVEAQARLKQEDGLSAQRFCELLGISERTFRDWKAKATAPRPAKPVPEPTPTPSPKGDKKNRGRFALDVTAPGVQAMADTSAWEILGMPLKIVALQDPGNRKEKLWESFAVDTTEDAQLVIDVVTAALQDRPGTQFITDQGTPYMAKATEEALEALEIEHAPQKEGTPTDKATQERSFGMVKQALEPLTDLSRRIGESFPSLKRPDLAKAVGRLLLATYLRVYEAASRSGGYPLSTKHPDELRLIIEEQRAKARAENRSVRLLLRHIHAAYHFPGSVQKFIRTHRNRALEDIQEAERRLRAQRDRFDKIWNFERYYSTILEDVADINEPRRANDRAYKLRILREQDEWRQEQRKDGLREQRLQDEPEAHLEDGLDLIASHWRPTEKALLSGGKGMGTAYVREALESMKHQDPYTVADRAQATWKNWLVKNEPEESKADAVRTVFEQKLQDFVEPPPCVQGLMNNMIGVKSDRQEGRLSIRHSHLRN